MLFALKYFYFQVNLNIKTFLEYFFTTEFRFFKLRKKVSSNKTVFFFHFFTYI